MGLRLWFCGVRGSTPAPGHEFAGVGGHTSCLAVLTGGADVPRLVLDAGTGLQALSARLEHRAFSGTILLTHLHWDHLQGLPFFRAGDQPAADVRVLVPAQGDARDVIARALSPPHFPIDPDGLLGTWHFAGIEAGALEVEGVRVTAVDVAHKGGRTFGYRLDADGRSVAYLPDHRPGGDDVRGGDAGASLAAVEQLCAGVDVLVHDAQFVAAERTLAAAYGHSTVDEAVALATRCGVGRLVLFHHAPTRTDAQARSIAAAAGDGPLAVVLATEGLVLDV